MFDQVIFHQLIVDLDNAATAHLKGRSLELLAQYLFNSIEGIEVRETNVLTPSEEIDLLLWNAKTLTVFEPWDNIIPVECKNWSKPVGSSVIDNFAAKIRQKHLKTGIFIAANGVTGDFENGNNENKGAVYRLHEHLTRDGLRIVIIRMEDLRTLIDIDDFVELIKDRYCKVYMHKVF